MDDYVEPTFKPELSTNFVNIYKPRKVKQRKASQCMPSPTVMSLQDREAYQTSTASLMSMGLRVPRISPPRYQSEDVPPETPGNQANTKKQVTQQQMIIENRIRRLNQERDKTLQIIEKTIRQTYKFKSV